MGRLELEGMDALIDKINKLGEKGEEIKKNALKRAGDKVKSSY
ncbi:hypothetical protein [Caloranaerobacter azorensis]|nr:hypothetical protein [Caloranaerobacter azorensis]